MMDRPTPIVAGLGELLWDCFEDSKHPGGAPANVAFHANQLGCRGLVATRIGRDALGDGLLEFLVEHGLETTAVQRDAEHATGTVSVEMSETGDPTYTIHEDAAWDYLEFTPELESIMHAADAVCFGTLAQRAPTSRQTIHECLAATRPDCLRIYDVNLRQQWYRREWIERSLEAATVLKLNESELRVLCSLLDLRVCRPEESGAELRERFGLEMVCFTCGSGGCLLFGEDDSVARPVPEVHVVDAVGAGDAFTAALITARLANWPLKTCAEFANSVGALVVSHSGAMPLLKDEYQALLRETTDAQ